MTKTCEHGMWLPIAGEINDDETLNWSRPVLCVLYLIGLLWSFMGVGIVADVFMEAIETITATTKKIKGPDGNDYDVKVRVCRLISARAAKRPDFRSFVTTDIKFFVTGGKRRKR